MRCLAPHIRAGVGDGDTPEAKRNAAAVTICIISIVDRVLAQLGHCAGFVGMHSKNKKSNMRNIAPLARHPRCCRAAALYQPHHPSLCAIPHRLAPQMLGQDLVFVVTNHLYVQAIAAACKCLCTLASLSFEAAQLLQHRVQVGALLWWSCDASAPGKRQRRLWHRRRACTHSQQRATAPSHVPLDATGALHHAGQSQRGV